MIRLNSAKLAKTSVVNASSCIFHWKPEKQSLVTLAFVSTKTISAEQEFFFSP